MRFELFIKQLREILPGPEGFAGTGSFEEGFSDMRKAEEIVDCIEKEFNDLNKQLENCVEFGTGGV
jgi:hypothetical protein